MSIDYYRLREMVWTVEDPTAYALGKSYAAEDYLEDLAPDMARELLRLHDGVDKLREMCLLERDAAFHATPMRADEVEAFNLCAERLTDLLEGDTE